MTTVSTLKLADVAKILSGYAFDSCCFADSGDLPIVRIRDVVRGYSNTFYTGEYSETFVVKNGDLLIGMDGEFNTALWGGGRAVLNQRVCKVIPDESVIDKAYLYYFLPKELKAIEDATAFVTVKHLSVKSLQAIEIPLPPLPEQKRIAAILDKADSIRRKRQEAVRLTEELLRSVFLDMFGDPESNDWPITTIAGIAKPGSGAIRTGPFGSQLLHSEFVDEGIAVLGIDNAVANEFRWSERRFISEAKYQELTRYTVKPGDVIITIMGTCGRCAVVPDDIPVAINTKHLCCITLDQAKCLPAFVHSYFLQHRIARRYLEKTAKGAIMDGLNMGIIKDMPIPIPPMNLQMKFARSISATKKVQKSQQAALAEEDTLFNSLLQRAFKGEL